MLLPIAQKLKSLRVILASQSQGRRELLERVDMFKFQVMPSSFEENLDKSQFSDPIDYVRATCEGKVNDMMPKLEEVEWDLVIFADTICDLDGKIIEKPQDAEDAANMLRSFQGRTLLVHTCVHVACNLSEPILHKQFVETSEIEVGELTEEAIQAYVADESFWKGRAGGFGVQSKGCTMVKSVRGCYNNIIGLPLYKLQCAILELVSLSD